MAELHTYRLGKTLGIGAFGKVKLAEHLITGHMVAIKILNRAKIMALDMGEKVCVERRCVLTRAIALTLLNPKVKREINILQRCTHPHIIRLYEVVKG